MHIYALFHILKNIPDGSYYSFYYHIDIQDGSEDFLYIDMFVQRENMIVKVFSG